ncbi:MAG: putative F420-dependent oxidoreductase [Candidatus Aldehydirespiratoraceae bacterium]|jgi:probable F420-dependent oxidoreductase
MTRPFRFAVQSYAATSARDWRDQAQRAEALGYSTFHTADHHIGPGPALDPTNHGVQDFAAVPAIAAAAATTSRINVGCRVFCTDYRNPVIFAKELATLDVLSDGRLEVGLGCGWLANEYEAIGIPFDRPGVRIDRMEETLAVIRAHFADGQVDVVGEHVHASGFEGVPKPTSAGGPPIMIGGGSPRILGIAGREADIVSLNFDNSSGRLGTEGVGSGQREQTTQKIEWIRKGAGDRLDGRTFDDLELEIAAYFTQVTDDAPSAIAMMASRFGTSPELFADHPHALIGSVDHICDTLEARRNKFGISYITVSVRAMNDFAPVVARLSGT